MSTLVCFALKEEAAPFRKRAAANANAAILIVGIGRQNAEHSVRNYLREHSPGVVLTCGFAGGLNLDLKVGDMVFEIGDRTLKLGNQLLAAGARPAKFTCADRVATTVAEKKKLRDETGADAVEMESAAIRAVCQERNIACHTIRVISDAANEDLPLDFNALAKPDKNLDFGKLALAIAKSPGKIGALMELRKRTNFAAGRLADVLERVISP